MLKIISLIVIASLLLGYVWYADILPFEVAVSNQEQNIPIENIQKIPIKITPKNNQIVRYSFENIPNVPDKQIPINALKLAISSWEKNNPNLEFIQSKNPDIEIIWSKYASSTHTGIATCDSILFGAISHCVLEISIGAEDCNLNFVQNDKNMVANILMHEIGHALGLGHSSKVDHLMYSTESPEIKYDSKGFIIPEKLNGLYVGQNLLLHNQQEIKLKIKTLNMSITREQSQYDQYNQEYQYYDDETLSDKNYDEYLAIYSKLITQGEKVNSSIERQNLLIDEINEIVIELGCNPNFIIES